MKPRSKYDPGRLPLMGREMPKQGDGESEDCSSDESMKNSFGFIPVLKPNISANIHRLYKGLKSFSLPVVCVQGRRGGGRGGPEIGPPTDVKHVTHIGWNDCDTMNDIFDSHIPLASHEVKTLST